MLDLRQKQYLLFDLDGTMLDLEDLNYSCFRDACKQTDNLDLSYDEYMQYIAGAGSRVGLTRYYDAKNMTKTSEEIEAIKKIYRDRKQQYLDDQFESVVKKISGIDGFLRRAKELGKKIAVGTSTGRRFAIQLLERSKLLPYFDAVITVDDVSQTKPAPDIFLKALQSIGGTKNEAVIFEDSANGVAAATNTGIDFIVVHNPGKNDNIVSTAAYSLRSYTDLVDLL